MTISKRPLAGVVFDMDGLMFDTERIVQLSWDIAGDALGYQQLGNNIYNTLGMNLKSRKEYFFKTYGSNFPFEAFSQEYRKAFLHIAKTKGVPQKRGLQELLDFLQDTGYPMVIATSSRPHHCLERIEEAGITDYFCGIISGDMVAHSKPHPQIYQLACEKLSASPGELIALEDSGNGLKAALTAGLMAIMVPDLIMELPEIEPFLEAKLDSLSAVASYIKENFYLK